MNGLAYVGNYWTLLLGTLICLAPLLSTQSRFTVVGSGCNMAYRNCCGQTIMGVVLYDIGPISFCKEEL